MRPARRRPGPIMGRQTLKRQSRATLAVASCLEDAHVVNDPRNCPFRRPGSTGDTGQFQAPSTLVCPDAAMITSAPSLKSTRHVGKSLGDFSPLRRRMGSTSAPLRADSSDHCDASVAHASSREKSDLNCEIEAAGDAGASSLLGSRQASPADPTCGSTHDRQGNNMTPSDR